MKAAALVLLWASAAAAQPGAGNEEAHNVHLVDFHDLAVRSAYQPTIKKQGDRWIAYKGKGKSIRLIRRVRPDAGRERGWKSRANTATAARPPCSGRGAPTAEIQSNTYASY
jgi:hypothetical protein